VHGVKRFEGSERTLVSGLAYHRMMIEMIEALREQAVGASAAR
jgi:hypothetical protein